MQHPCHGPPPSLNFIALLHDPTSTPINLVHGVALYEKTDLISDQVHAKLDLSQSQENIKSMNAAFGLITVDIFIMKPV